MRLFNCSKCGAVENTALGAYWWNRRKGKPGLCSECWTAGVMFPKRFDKVAEQGAHS